MWWVPGGLMKTKKGFVTNSSTCSFLIIVENSLQPEEIANIILSLVDRLPNASHLINEMSEWTTEFYRTTSDLVEIFSKKLYWEYVRKYSKTTRFNLFIENFTIAGAFLQAITENGKIKTGELSIEDVSDNYPECSGRK